MTAEQVDALADLAWTEVDAAQTTLALPLGATEQHGPHLPLSTDTDIAVALAQRLAAIRPEVAVAPPLAYGASGEHQHFAGTLSIGRAAVEQVLVELARSAALTFRRVIIISAHGGNAHPVSRAVEQLRGEGRDVRAWSPAETWKGDAHAGRTETSVMLALDPERVRLGAAEAGDVRPLAEVMPLLGRCGVRAVSPNGVLGDPAGASAAHGDQLLAAAAQRLAAAVNDWPRDGRTWL
jgi:mycofactocin precursor peptide peptidase